MLAPGATPDMLMGAKGENRPPAIEATAVPWPSSSDTPAEQTKVTAAQDDSAETRPAISGFDA